MTFFEKLLFIVETAYVVHWRFCDTTNLTGVQMILKIFNGITQSLMEINMC